jgi:hypothetical protein
MISAHYDKTANTERLITVSGNKKSFTAYLSNIPCLLQPLSDSVSEDMPGAFGKEFLMISGIVDIAEGDRVIIDSKEYRVMGTEALNFGRNPHRETRLKLFTSS